MKQNNLWIAALALGITLSAHGQQSGGGISPTMLQQIKQSYQGTPTDKAIRNAITNNDINKLAVNGESKNNLDTYFSNKVESKGISNQRSSGRCWLFTGLNVFRAQAIHKYDMGEFQFSQNYSFFWDQLEKANLFLQGHHRYSSETDGRQDGGMAVQEPDRRRRAVHGCLRYLNQVWRGSRRGHGRDQQ